MKKYIYEDSGAIFMYIVLSIITGGLGILFVLSKFLSNLPSAGLHAVFVIFAILWMVGSLLLVCPADPYDGV